MFGLTGPRGHGQGRLADHYAAIVGLKGFEHSYPHELSGGMLKRAELARALVVKPEILFMDEPFSALDALMNLRMRNELLRILAEERHTVLLITHDVEEAIHVADRVLVLSPRPARVQATFDVAIPHPRKLTSPRCRRFGSRSCASWASTAASDRHLVLCRTARLLSPKAYRGAAGRRVRQHLAHEQLDRDPGADLSVRRRPRRLSRPGRAGERR
jgi:ABC-type sulfate/molybdate transport systems ATPase subunit